MADSVLERLLLGSGLLAMISDIAGAGGGAYSIALPLFALVALWGANPRGLLAYGLASALSVVFDIIFMGAQAAGGVGGIRPDAAIGACLRARERASERARAPRARTVPPPPPRRHTSRSPPLRASSATRTAPPARSQHSRQST